MPYNYSVGTCSYDEECAYRSRSIDSNAYRIYMWWHGSGVHKFHHSRRNLQDDARAHGKHWFGSRGRNALSGVLCAECSSTI